MMVLLGDVPSGVRSLVLAINKKIKKLKNETSNSTYGEWSSLLDQECLKSINRNDKKT